MTIRDSLAQVQELLGRATPGHEVMDSLMTRFRQRRCRHRFFLEDLKMVNPSGDKDRVSWACGDCGKVFVAHCGLDISPANGYTYRRTEASP